MNWQMHRISMGTFALDGGAMFGIIPKPLWSKQHPADERNRIQMDTHCLLLIGDDRKIVIEVGNGVDYDAKMLEQYDMRGLQTWQQALQPFKLHPEEITDVIVTHLHFDHADGLAFKKPDGAYTLTFPKATHYVQRQQWEWAQKPSERDAGSYKAAAFYPFQAGKAKVKFVEGDQEILPGIRAQVIHGHSPGQQLVHLDHGKQHYVFVADLTPTTSHFHLPWIMAYDLLPLDTLKEKKSFFAEAAAKQWNLWLYHEPKNYLVRAHFDGKRYQLGEVIDRC